jgi:hypothetical protein
VPWSQRGNKAGNGKHIYVFIKVKVIFKPEVFEKNPGRQDLQLVDPI